MTMRFVISISILIAVATSTAMPSAHGEQHTPKNNAVPVMVGIPGKAYELGKFEVTQAEWQAVMGSNPSQFKGGNLPVENLSWNDIQVYIAKLNKKTGKQYRLPTDEEWKYACYGGDPSSDYCGGNDFDAVAWHSGNGNDKTHPVGQKQANDYGLYDMSGNVSELGVDLNEKGKCIVFGGGYYSGWEGSLGKESVPIPTNEITLYGFRLARSLPTVVMIPASLAAKKPKPVLIPEMVAIPGKDYEIGKFEVTQPEWRSVMGDNPSKARSSFKDDLLPVENVSWNDVQEYITKLNEKTGKQYRLPTVEEWRYACHGDTNTPNCGSNNLDDVSWYNKNSREITHPVGQLQPNTFGLFDMSGNVWEWLSDCYQGNCTIRAYIGGSSLNDGTDTYYAMRGEVTETSAYRGFRLARTRP